MNKAAALAILGLRGDENRDSVTRTYGERLALVQEQLVSAQSEVERNAHGARLAELSQAYELVTATGRYASSNEAEATVLRSGTAMSLPQSGHEFVRMEPGAIIADRLEIGGLLGEGGMGCVYAARDRLRVEDVAIKVLRQDLQFSVAAKDRFLAEAKVSCNLSHPNIVRVHDVGISGGTYYFSMERLKGRTLRQQMDQYRKKKRAFRVAEVTDIARQLIDALRYAHRYIVHRDIKPENIWLAEDGTVKLMDFGIARAFSNSQMTQTGMMLGTAYYMSPEQRADSKKIDWRTDQYALGVVLYELFAGTLPTGAVQPIENIRRDLPKRYAGALMRAMAPLPGKRFDSLDEMLEEILAPRPPRFRLARLVVIGAALTAAFVTLHDHPWILKASAVATAVKTEFAGASARVAGSWDAPEVGRADGSPPAKLPLPEQTPAAAPAVPQMEFVSESVPESAESIPGELESGALDSAALQPVALEPAASGPVALEPVSLDSEAPLQTPAPSNADAITATSPSEASPQAEANATTSSSSESSAAGSIDTRRDECIAQCERDDCDKAGESTQQCLDKLRFCRESCQ
jgi:serine/threonine protein kinase